MTKFRNYLIPVFLGLLLLATIVICLSIGPVSIDLQEVLKSLLNKTGLFNNSIQEKTSLVLWNIRMPRVLTGLIVGACLSVSGAALQGLFRNPLADPTIIGISSGATMATAMTIVLLPASIQLHSGLQGLSMISLAGFAGAALMAFIVFHISRDKQNTNVITLLLAGIAINALTSALTGLFSYLANDVQLRTLIFWTLGSLSSANWSIVSLLFVVLLICVPGILPLARPLNALSLGESEASHLGFSIEKLKIRIILFTALGVGFSVAFCGMIAFVGLLVPHLIRLMGFHNYKMLLPLSMIGGAIFLCLADSLARVIVAPSELPIGILTSLTGAPFFLILLIKQKKKVYATT